MITYTLIHFPENPSNLHVSDQAIESTEASGCVCERNSWRNWAKDSEETLALDHGSAIY